MTEEWEEHQKGSGVKTMMSQVGARYPDHDGDFMEHQERMEAEMARVDSKSSEQLAKEKAKLAEAMKNVQRRTGLHKGRSGVKPSRSDTRGDKNIGGEGREDATEVATPRLPVTPKEEEELTLKQAMQLTVDVVVTQRHPHDLMHVDEKFLWSVGEVIEGADIWKKHTAEEIFSDPKLYLELLVELLDPCWYQLDIFHIITSRALAFNPDLPKWLSDPGEVFKLKYQKNIKREPNFGRPGDRANAMKIVEENYTQRLQQQMMLDRPVIHRRELTSREVERRYIEAHPGADLSIGNDGAIDGTKIEDSMMSSTDPKEEEEEEEDKQTWQEAYADYEIKCRECGCKYTISAEDIGIKDPSCPRCLEIKTEADSNASKSEFVIPDENGDE